MSRFRRLLRWTLITFLILALAGLVGLGVLYYTVSSKVPDVQSLRNVELQEPLYIYASDDEVLGCDLLITHTTHHAHSLENATWC